MEREKLDLNVLVQLYKVAEENHRFYVAKRFMIISLYFPLMSLVLSGIYILAGSQSLYRILICTLGLVLTLFLYSLEIRNWILSNICLHRSKEIGAKIDGDANLHLSLVKSYDTELLKGSTFLDRWLSKNRCGRKIARTQHELVSILTVLLLLYWISLAIISIFL